jgi:hypothetical protein
MADRKISDLTALTTPAAGDYLPIIDISEPLAANKNKRITIEELLRGAPDGTAGAPGIAFESDPNTGIYSPGADQVAISTNGTERLRIDADGDVGIGVTNPLYPIHVVTSGQSSAAFRNSGAANSQILVGNTAGDTSFRTLSTGDGFIFSDTGKYLAFGTNGSAERMRLDSSGRLGLGTSSPAELLDVGAATNPTASIRTTSAVTSTATLKLQGYRTSGDTGRLAEISVINTRDGDEQASIEITADGDTEGKFTFKSATNSLCEFGNSFTRFFSSNTERLRITSTGLVGIGTSDPGSFNAVGNRLVIGSGSGNQGATIFSGSTSTSSLIFAGSVGGTQGQIFYRHNDNSFGFITNTNVSALNIDSSGRLLVGTSTARDKFFNASSNATTFQVERVGASGAIGYQTASFITNSSDGIGSYVTLGASRGTAVNSYTALQSGDVVGKLAFQGADGTELVSAAEITAVVDGTPGANDMPGRLVFSTTADGAASPTERMRIDSSGRVGIGTTSPSDFLHVGTTTTGGNIRIVSSIDGANGQLRLFGADGVEKLQIYSANTAAGVYTVTVPFQFYIANQERARIDSSGRLLVGTSTARTTVGSNQTPVVQVESTTAGLGLFTAYNQNNAFGSVVAIAKSRGTAVGSNTIVQSGDQIGGVFFYGADGVDTATAAGIECYVDDTPGSNDMPGRLVFSTTADGASSPTERMRITSDAYVRLASGTGGIQFNGDTAAANALDDYEEGTWTPALAGSTTAGTYETSFASGWYTKIGRQVTVQFRVNLAGSITGGGVGFAVITGLPFNTSTDNYANGGSVLLSGVDFNDSAKHLYLYKRSTTSAQLVISEVFDNASAQDVGIADFAASSIVAGSLIYFIS